MDYGAKSKIRYVITDEILAQTNLALKTISTVTITETNALIYATVETLQESVGKKNLEFEHTTISGCSGGRERLIDWYQMSANSVKWPKEMRPTKHEWLRKLRDTLATTAREAAKHCPVALAAQLKNYNSENEARNINSLFSTDG